MFAIANLNISPIVSRAISYINSFLGFYINNCKPCSGKLKSLYDNKVLKVPNPDFIVKFLAFDINKLSSKGLGKIYSSEIV